MITTLSFYFLPPNAGRIGGAGRTCPQYELGIYALGTSENQDQVKIIAYRIFGKEHEHSGILVRTKPA